MACRRGRVGLMDGAFKVGAIKVGLLLPTMGWIDVVIEPYMLRPEGLAETIRWAASTHTSIEIRGALSGRVMKIQGAHIIAWSIDASKGASHE